MTKLLHNPLFSLSYSVCSRLNLAVAELPINKATQEALGTSFTSTLKQPAVMHGSDSLTFWKERLRTTNPGFNLKAV